MSFDLIAPVYDRLTRLVFGSLLERVQLWQISHWPAGFTADVVLISGDGTGFVTGQLLKSRLARKVVYVEPSCKMQQAAQRRLAPYSHLIMFVKAEQPPVQIQADVVMTNFFLDLFTETDLALVIKKHLAILKPGGYWLAADFYAKGQKRFSTLWQPFVVRLMYLFFGQISGLKTRRLPDIPTALVTDNSLFLLRKQTWQDRFIFSGIWQKKGDSVTLSAGQTPA